jgi:hypothetical protein
MASTVKIENFKRDRITLRFANGTQKVLGSRDDRMIVDPSVPKPVIELTTDEWKELKTRKAIQGLLDSGDIRATA